MTKGSWNHVLFYTKVCLSAITTDNAMDKNIQRIFIHAKHVMAFEKKKKEEELQLFYK